MWSATPAASPQSIQEDGNAAIIPTHDSLQKEVMASFHFMFILPHHSNLFSQNIIPIKLLFSWSCQPPSLSQYREQGPASTIPAHRLQGEGNNSEFSSPITFSSTNHFYFFQHLFPIKLLFSQPCWQPSLSQSREQGLMLPSPSATCRQKATTVSFQLLFIFTPPFRFSHSIFYQFHRYSVSHASCSPSVEKGNKGVLCAITSMPTPPSAR